MGLRALTVGRNSTVKIGRNLASSPKKSHGDESHDLLEVHLEQVSKLSKSSAHLPLVGTDIVSHSGRGDGVLQIRFAIEGMFVLHRNIAVGCHD
jgi:hypothetical protein